VDSKALVMNGKEIALTLSDWLELLQLYRTWFSTSPGGWRWWRWWR